MVTTQTIYFAEFKADIEKGNQSNPFNGVTSCYVSSSTGKIVPTPCNAVECLSLSIMAHPNPKETGAD